MGSRHQTEWAGWLDPRSEQENPGCTPQSWRCWDWTHSALGWVKVPGGECRCQPTGGELKRQGKPLITEDRQTASKSTEKMPHVISHQGNANSKQRDATTRL